MTLLASSSCRGVLGKRARIGALLLLEALEVADFRLDLVVDVRLLAALHQILIFFLSKLLSVIIVQISLGFLPHLARTVLTGLEHVDAGERADPCRRAGFSRARPCRHDAGALRRVEQHSSLAPRGPDRRYALWRQHRAIEAHPP